jgi:hypothetical protein
MPMMMMMMMREGRTAAEAIATAVVSLSSLHKNI